jgi:hypothetical protein
MLHIVLRRFEIQGQNQFLIMVTPVLVVFIRKLFHTGGGWNMFSKNLDLQHQLFYSHNLDITDR